MENNDNSTAEETKKEKPLVPSEEDIEKELLEEENLLPPEEEDAKQFNTGNVFLIIFIAIALIVLIFLLFGNKKKKEAETKELEASGTKTEFAINFNDKPIKTKTDNGVVFEEVDNQEETYVTEKDKKEENTDEILATLPDNLQLNFDDTSLEQNKAPITPVGQTSSSSVSTRPDTRNSKSPRQVEGIKGLSYQQDSNMNSLGNILNGNASNSNQYGINNPLPPKDDYISKQMDMIKGLQAPYMNNNQSPQQQYQTNKEQFFNNQGNFSQGQYLSNSSLWDGTIISGALVTAINTDNPGVVIARVTENVWSSYDHSFLLIPEGSLLYATYNSSVNYGQDKVQVAWNLLIRPDGYRVELGNMNGVNAQGMSGYDGKVSNHPWETLKALGMVAVFSIIQTEITGQITDQNNDYIKNAMTDVYAQSSNIGNRILDKALDIKPTIRIKEGTEIKIITNKPLELPPVEIPEVSKKYIRTK